MFVWCLLIVVGRCRLSCVVRCLLIGVGCGFVAFVVVAWWLVYFLTFVCECLQECVVCLCASVYFVVRLFGGAWCVVCCWFVFVA